MQYSSRIVAGEKQIASTSDMEVIPVGKRSQDIRNIRGAVIFNEFSEEYFFIGSIVNIGR